MAPRPGGARVRLGSVPLYGEVAAEVDVLVSETVAAW